MTSTPGNARVEIESNPYTLTGDTFSPRSLLGLERRYTIPERIVCAGGGVFNSTVIPPAGVRLLITGVSVDWGVAPTANGAIALQVTLAGSGILGTPDLPPGVFAQATPTINVPAMTPISTVVAAHPEGLNLVTREGDGVSSLFRVQQAVGGPDIYNVTVYYSPLYAEDLGC